MLMFELPWPHKKSRCGGSSIHDTPSFILPNQRRHFSIALFDRYKTIPYSLHQRCGLWSSSSLFRSSITGIALSLSCDSKAADRVLPNAVVGFCFIVLHLCWSREGLTSIHLLASWHPNSFHYAHIETILATTCCRNLFGRKLASSAKWRSGSRRPFLGR